MILLDLRKYPVTDYEKMIALSCGSDGRCGMHGYWRNVSRMGGVSTTRFSSEDKLTHYIQEGSVGDTYFFHGVIQIVRICVY